jgi:Uma2 family endonuclease
MYGGPARTEERRVAAPIGQRHQAIQLSLLIAIREAAGLRDRAKQSSHRVLGDMDVLTADSPKLHFRRPDVVVYRCIDDDRGRWGRKPIAADCLIASEIVSADSVTTDIRDKRAEYAAAGIRTTGSSA